METTLPVAVEASFTEDHLFYVLGVLFLFIVCVLKAFVRCANRFYEHIEDQKAAISEYLDKRFGRAALWNEVKDELGKPEMGLSGGARLLHRS